MKKHILLFSFCCFFFNVVAQDCLPDTLVLSTQQEIDNFAIDYPNCTNITGHIQITESNPGGITNLNGLSQIIRVEGDFKILENTALIDLSGLDNLNFVGHFHIKNNSSLVSLEGLGGLESIGEVGALLSEGGVLRLEYNESLENIMGLSSLQRIEHSINCRNNPQLSGLSGLDALTSLYSLSIINCPAITDLTGMPNLTDLSTLSLLGNDGLTSLQGLEQSLNISSIQINSNPLLTTLTDLPPLDSLYRSVILKDNLSLQNLDGLEGVKTLSGSLWIEENENLESISGLSNLTFVSTYLFVINNPNLVSLEGLNSVEYVDGSLTIDENDLITDLSGLQSLDTINGWCNIHRNNSLTSLSGLEALESVETNFTLLDNPVLTDLSALQQMSVGIYFAISGNTSLESLSGLEGIQGFKNNSNNIISINNNPVLSDISALEGINLETLDKLTLKNNDQLSFCSQQNICNYLLEGGYAEVYNNDPGCEHINEVILGCFDGQDHSYVVGNVTADLNDNCIIDPDEITVEDWLITVENNDYQWVTSTDSLGNYWLPVFEGDWNMNVLSPIDFWTPCFSDSLIYAGATGDSITTDFSLSPEGDCSFIDWSLHIGSMRACFTNRFVIDYCNHGALPAEDMIVSVALDSFLLFENASVPYTLDGDGNYLFEVGALDVFECGSFFLDAYLDCDSVSIWDLQCLEVEIMSEELCSPDSLWDGSIIMVSGFCENDSIFFNLENIGMGDMGEEAQLRVEIVIDDIVLLHDVDEYQLVAGGMQQIGYPLEGQGMRLEADQTEGFPVEETASVVVPSCDDIVNNEVFFVFPLSDNGNPFQETFCAPVTSSFDPNDKTAIPGGNPVNRIYKDWPIQYTIRFQNTGNDTAFLVVVRDRISEDLDLTTLEINSASHPFTWELGAARTLDFTFENILLPDSSTNQVASNGFVKFTIRPNQSVAFDEDIENTAAIYFDFNEPIITNTTKHRILKPYVTTSEELFICANEEYLGIPVNADTTIQELISFAEYDSIHFVHLKLQGLVSNNIDTTVTSGTYIHNVLIEGDTAFVLILMDQYGCDSTINYNVGVLTNTNTANNNFDSVQLFPNPTSDLLTVLNHRNNKPQRWTLQTMLGTTVWEKYLDANEELKNIKLKHLPKGVYLLQVESAERKRLWKVMRY